ncbi:MAG TPA: serine hydrolase domain-containing protein [Chthonomonadaceae bacterium]|nr:serine hydrolase domain-containing protein [Chthonomonadaceae bacterium]
MIKKSMMEVVMLLFLIGGALAACAAGPAGQPSLPDTPAGRALAGWLQACQSGKPEQMLQFVTRHYDPQALNEVPAQDRAARMRMRYQTYRILQLDRVESSTPTRVTGLFRSPITETWLRISADVTPEEPHYLTGVSIEEIPAPAGVGRPKYSDAELGHQLGKYLKKLAHEDIFSGAVMVSRNGKTLYKGAWGLANIGYHVPNQVDTKFNLGSMNKMFTAVAIAQLAQQGKLRFEDPIGKYLPDLPNADMAHKVTIHHLLTHTSGVGDYFNDRFDEASRARFREVKDYLPLFVDSPLAFEPGARFRYSNGGFMLLGAIVEKVSGQNYFDYVREHIYRPAGMSDTDAYSLDHDTPKLATGYTRMDGDDLHGNAGPHNNLFMHVMRGGPAGGGYSTVEDLTRFSEALLGGKLLDKKYVDLLLTGKVEVGMEPGVRYAYGFFTRNENGQRIVGHSGGFPGISSNLDIYLDSGYTVVVMSNYDPGTAELVSGWIHDRLGG